MTRLNFLLLLAVMASAMALVHSQYQSRRLYTELHRAVADARQLETEHQRLQVQKRAQATPLRVEQLARDRLGMRMATPAITQYVLQDGTVLTPPAPVEAPPAKAGAAAGARR